MDHELVSATSRAATSLTAGDSHSRENSGFSVLVSAVS